ncbi:MAG: hypothetical protein ACE5HI_12340 [bacterium]
MRLIVRGVKIQVKHSMEQLRHTLLDVTFFFTSTTILPTSSRGPGAPAIALAGWARQPPASRRAPGSASQSWSQSQEFPP